jgi:hypothetical protein
MSGALVYGIVTTICLIFANFERFLCKKAKEGVGGPSRQHDGDAVELAGHLALGRGGGRDVPFDVGSSARERAASISARNVVPSSGQENSNHGHSMAQVTPYESGAP